MTVRQVIQPVIRPIITQPIIQPMITEQTTVRMDYKHKTAHTYIVMNHRLQFAVLVFILCLSVCIMHVPGC